MTDKPYESAYREGPKPVCDPEFWRQRIFEGIATGKHLHQIIWDEQWEMWDYALFETAGILKQNVPKGCKLLDGGCGYGAMIDSLKISGLEESIHPHYVGVDISPDLIEIGKYRYPGWDLRVGDLRDLSNFKNKQFDWIVLRSIRDMVEENEPGAEAYTKIRNEMSRIGKFLLVIEYPVERYGIVEFWVTDFEEGKTRKFCSKRGAIRGVRD